MRFFWYTHSLVPPHHTWRKWLNAWKDQFWSSFCDNQLSFWTSPEAFVFSSWALSQDFGSVSTPLLSPCPFLLSVCLCWTCPFQQHSLFSSSLTWGNVYSALGPTEALTSIKQIDGRFNTFPNYFLQMLFKTNNLWNLSDTRKYSPGKIVLFGSLKRKTITKKE